MEIFLLGISLIITGEAIKEAGSFFTKIEEILSADNLKKLKETWLINIPVKIAMEIAVKYFKNFLII